LFRQLQQRLIEAVGRHLRSHGVDSGQIVVEQPPQAAMGEYALPVFQLAKTLRKPPRRIAEEIIAGVGAIEGFEKLEVAGGGYINARVDRARFASALSQGTGAGFESGADGKILVEHTSINPNKAVHIGHQRNAILGDTFVRLLRAAGRKVSVQNYIDNTGVQVADVVVGFLFLEKKSKAEVLEIVRSDPKLDYTCWDLYARVSQWYAESEENQARRGEVLHALEEGKNDIAAAAEALSTAIVRFHLRTMERLGVEYDFLPRESEILHLHFWELAFRQLREKSVLYYETRGKPNRRAR
jgi:arginyl-tRNA synthetase